MANGAPNENQQVFKKLSTVITDADDLATFITFLCTNEGHIRMDALVAVLNNDTIFKVVALKLLAKFKDSILTEEFEQMMAMVGQSYEKDEFTIVKANKEYEKSKMFIVNFQQAFQVLPIEQQTTMISSLVDMAKTIVGMPVEKQTTTTMSDLISWGRKIVGMEIVPPPNGTLKACQQISCFTAQVLIVGVFLAYEILKNIANWWRGEISGKRCVKQIIDYASTATGGFCGGFVGSLIGMAFLPAPVAWVAPVVGGIYGSYKAAEWSKHLTEWLFDLPPTIALENAYTYLELKPSCTNLEINAAFKKLALKHHPDKGGSAEAFQKLQFSTAIIKQARGQGV